MPPDMIQTTTMPEKEDPLSSHQERQESESTSNGDQEDSLETDSMQVEPALQPESHSAKGTSTKEISSVIVVDDGDDYIFSQSPLDTSSAQGIQSLKNMIALKHLNHEERSRVLAELGSKIPPTSAGLSSSASSSNSSHSQSPSPPPLFATTSTTTTSTTTHPTSHHTPSSLPKPLSLDPPSGTTEEANGGFDQHVLNLDDTLQEEEASPDPTAPSQMEDQVPLPEPRHPTTALPHEVDYETEVASMPRSARLYFLYNYLDEPLESGFYAVPREFVQFPTLKELRAITTTQKPAFNSSLSHVFLIDFADEKVMALRKEAAERLAATRSKRFAAKVKELLVVLREKFPYSGPYAAQTEVTNLTKDKKSMVVQVGMLKKLSHEELAILFKLLCEDAHIECRVVRGKNPQNRDCAWGFVREDSHQKWNLVSVVSGAIITNSLEAQEYTREGGTDNGIPPEGPFPSVHIPEATLAAAAWKLDPHSIVFGKPNKPLIRCHCHLYEETSPMVTCSTCKNLMHGPCQGYSRQEDLPSTFKCVACVADRAGNRAKWSLRYPQQVAPLPTPTPSAPTSAPIPSKHHSPGSSHKAAYHPTPAPLPPKDPMAMDVTSSSSYSVSFVDGDILEIPELPELPELPEIPDLPALPEGPKTPQPKLKLKLVMKSPEGTSIETQLNVESPMRRGRKKSRAGEATDDDYDESSLTGTHEDEEGSTFSSAPMSSGEEEDDDEFDDDGLVAQEEDENDGNWGGKAPVTRTPSGGVIKRGRPAMPNSKRSQKPKPDPHAPGKPISCYHHFCKEVREDLLKTRTDVSYPVIGQIAGDRWKKLPAEQRAVYIKRANEQKQNYDKLMTQYKKTEHYAAYQKYLEEFYAQRPRAAVGRKRTYSNVSVVVEPTPFSSPTNQESNKRQRIPSRRLSMAATTEPAPVTPVKKEPPHPGTLARRRTMSSLYDLDDFVPSISTPAVLTPVRVKEVFVPSWKEVDEEEEAANAMEATDEGEGEEDTSDEAYFKRHEKFEHAERNRLPLPIERRFSISRVQEPPAPARTRRKGRQPSRDSQQSSPLATEIPMEEKEEAPLSGPPSTENLVKPEPMVAEETESLIPGKRELTELTSVPLQPVTSAD